MLRAGDPGLSRTHLYSIVLCDEERYTAMTMQPLKRGHVQSVSRKRSLAVSQISSKEEGEGDARGREAWRLH